ncbi:MULTISPECIES: MFS transporter [unclassified Micromonospora]|uniref:MFS transporter n=1 Tax=unclassified Micromonospora TaxID=2617518 RepID=UPI002415EE0B|nr:MULTISPECIES: MFS transporter [unclassified Micromonospora]MDG4817010.1 MFS transporter [Micromonospora sp. WMMD956]WFE59586.1 MFS transporter [Micromonospora sp. WMMD712]
MTRPGYLATLRLPGIPPVLAAGTLGRLAYGIVPFSTVVAFSTAHGFLAAGIASAGLMSAIAFLAPLRGRLTDRHGPRVLPLMAAVHVLLVVTTVLMIDTAAWPAAIATITLAGATAPPIGATVRTCWSRLVKDKDQLQQIHALDSIVEEMTFVVAPLVTALALGAISPRWVLPLGALLLIPATLGIALFAGTSTTPTAAAEASDGRARSRRSVMRLADGQGIVIPILALGAVGGGLGVLLPALAKASGDIATSGYGFAAYSLGGVIAGLVYGRLRWNLPLRRKYGVITACYTLGVALLIPTASTVLTLPAIFLAGAAMTPMFVVGYLLVDERIHPGQLTEANAWLGSGYNIGSAAGAALCGLLVTTLTPTAVAAVFALIAALGTLGTLRITRQPTPPHTSSPQPATAQPAA